MNQKRSPEGPPDVRFDIITEADARVLPVGSTVVVARGGHVTPLASDTLRERRVTILREDGVPSAEADGLAPPADIRIVAIGSDHRGFELKRSILAVLRSQGRSVVDLGTTDKATTVDYPDIAAVVARTVARREADAGIVIDSGGLGSAIAANKIRGIRAAMCDSEVLARYARQHNGCNVLALGAMLIAPDTALRIVETWLSTPMTEGRYIQRLAKIAALESSIR
jgi:ribose 5-phosphate isomerase B